MYTSQPVSNQYGWVQGMSLMEMEIIQAAYRNMNRNGPSWNQLVGKEGWG